MRARHELPLLLARFAFLALGACESKPAPTPVSRAPAMRIRGDTAAPCRPIDGAPGSFTAARAAEITRGAFHLTVVATQGAGTDTIVRGRLTLVPTDSAFRRARNPAVTFPNRGATDVDLRRLGPVSLAYSPAVEDAEAPGIQVWLMGPELSMVAGNAYGRVTRHDAGVRFWVVEGSEAGFRGRWMDQGLAPLPTPGGYFCAVRL